MDYPDRERCEELLNEYNTPEHVRGHCRAVADTAYTIAEALNRHGRKLDLELIEAAGMLHDIARVEDRHWDAGADIAEKLGYLKVADIIRVHMSYSPFSTLEDITETDLVCLGDRLVKEDNYVGLDERIEYIINKALNNGKKDAVPFIMKKKEDTRRFMDEIENEIGISIDDLMKRRDTHK